MSISPVLGTSSNYGSPYGSGPDLDGMGHRSIDAQFKELRDILLPLARAFADFDNHVKTISEAVAVVTSRITSVEQTVNALVAKMALFTALEQNVNTLALSLHVYARLKQMQPPALAAPTRLDLGLYLDIVLGPQPLGPSGPMAQGHMTTTATQDAGLILSQALKMNMHEVPLCFDFHVNNITREYLPGSKISGQQQTHPSANLPEYTAKQAPCLPGLYSKQEPNVRTLWPDVRMMVSPAKLIVHCATSEPRFWCVNPSHQRTEKLEDGSHHFGKFSSQSYKKSSLNEMSKVLSLSPHLTSAHKSFAFSIAEIELRIEFSNLHHPDTNSCEILLLLICVFLALLMMHCDKLFVKPAVWLRIARPMRDGRPFASSPFRRRVEAPLFAVSLFGGLCDLRSLQLGA